MLTRGKHLSVDPSDSSDSDSEDEPSWLHAQLRLEAYASLELGAALAEPDNYERAVQELTAIVAALPRSFVPLRKDAVAQVMADALLAVEKCDGRARCVRALARLVAACGKRPHLPQQRVRRLQREHRRAAVAFARARGSRAPAEGALPPGRALDLPHVCLEQVFAWLNPLELAACACACREWRAVLASPAALPLWTRQLALTFPRVQPGHQRPGCAVGPGEESRHRSADDRERFYSLAEAMPGKLGRYRHNRMAHQGARGVWWRRGVFTDAELPGLVPLDLREVVTYVFHNELPGDVE